MKKIVLIALLLLSACTAGHKPYTGPTDTLAQDLVAFPVSNSIDLVMVGDAIVHSNLYSDARLSGGGYDFTGMLDLIKPLVEPYDLGYYNQETILGGSKLGVSNYPRFNSPQEFGDAMLDAGFNLISLANNHTNDIGTKGILSADAYWKTKDAITTGAFATQAESEAVIVHELNGIKFGFLSYTYGINGTYLAPENQFMVNRVSKEKMKADCDALRPLVDVLIVAVHFGSEYQNYPNSYQKSVVNALVEDGVDIIIGNHAHAIEPIQWIGKTLVYYALGNFISGQNGTAQLIGLTSAITITKTVTGNTSQITLNNLKVDLNYTYYDSRKLNVRVYPWDKVTTKLLPDKAVWEAHFLEIVNAYGADITFGSVQKD